MFRVDADEWQTRAGRASARYESGATRGLDQRQLTQLANAAWAAGLCLLMAGDGESWENAPPDSWGRPIAAMKALLLAGDDATDAARWALAAGAEDATSAIGRYAAALARLVLGEDVEARVVASTLRDDDFPRAVADALVTIAAADRAGYLLAIEDVLESFEQRSDFLEDVPVADTVLVLQRLAASREVAVELPPSSLLP